MSLPELNDTDLQFLKDFMTLNSDMGWIAQIRTQSLMDVLDGASTHLQDAIQILARRVQPYAPGAAAVLRLIRVEHVGPYPGSYEYSIEHEGQVIFKSEAHRLGLKLAEFFSELKNEKDNPIPQP